MQDTPFEVYERQIRQELHNMFGPWGFNPANDILAITINRWGHGYNFFHAVITSYSIHYTKLYEGGRLVPQPALGGLELERDDRGPTATFQRVRPITLVAQEMLNRSQEKRAKAAARRVSVPDVVFLDEHGEERLRQIASLVVGGGPAPDVGVVV